MFRRPYIYIYKQNEFDIFIIFFWVLKTDFSKKSFFYLFQVKTSFLYVATITLFPKKKDTHTLEILL